MLKLLKYLKSKERLFIVFSLVLIVVQVWLDLKLPDYMSAITRTVETEGSEMSVVLRQGGAMLACALGSAVCSIVVGYFAAMVAAGFSKTMREAVYNRTMDFSMSEINRFSTSSLINRTTNDITQVQFLVSMGLQVLVKAPIIAVWAIIKIVGKNSAWSLATAVAVIILGIILAVVMRFAHPRFRAIQGLNDNVNRVARENLTGIRVVHAYNAEEYEEKKFDEANRALTENHLFAGRVMAIMMPGMTAINSGLTLAIYWIGAFLISNAASSADKLTLFSEMVVYLNYAMQVIMAFMMLNMIFMMLPRAQVSAGRIRAVLDTETSVKDGEGAQGIERGSVEFKNVSFGYSDTGETALKDITFKVGAGETVGIIGATGSGKTSLINLIPRFYDATDGSVYVDGVDVKKYKLKELRDKISYISQRAVLFSGSVKSNIAFGSGEGGTPGESEIDRALDIAQASEFVDKMEGGIKAPISQGGTNVSGGQRQRLSIARAIARGAEIIIFDDSFSALDYKTDRALRDALKKSLPGTTKIIVAQRIGTLRDADKIIVLEGGRAVGIGTHDELIENCETYREIAYSQLSEEELKDA